MHRSLRFAVSTLALLTLGVSAVAPRLRADARGRGAEPASTSGPCLFELLDVQKTGTIGIGSGGSIVQPFTVVGSVAACSLKAVSNWGAGSFEIRQWDPASALPDPTTVALRSVALNNSALYYGRPLVSWSRPIVTKTLPHVADPPTTTLAMLFHYFSGLYGMSGEISTNGAANLPRGYTEFAGTYTPLAGVSTVHALSLCGRSAADQELHVAQSVMRTDAAIDSTHWDVMQRFRVPQAVRLGWIEVALDGAPIAPWLTGTLQIVSGGGVTPPAIPEPLVSATFYPWTDQPSWVSHYDFDSTLVLQPDTDYWLRVRTVHTFKLRAHAVTGTEGADFAAGIGSLWSRTDPDLPWILESGRALSFRVIGDPAVVVGVAPAPARSVLALRATPNPSRGASVLSWTGATGGVRFDVLDARGRRVGGDARAAGSEGQWTWTLARGGPPLPPGLYFVRATDDAGHAASARIVLVK